MSNDSEGTEYHKIDTVWKRDTRGKIIAGEYSRPEFGYLAGLGWIWTEKVDGTNVRINYDGTDRHRTDPFSCIAGRTDAAQLPPTLVQRLIEIVKHAPFDTVFDTDPRVNVTLYGEGYGAKIQAGGGRYLPDRCDFVLFDIKIGSWWLMRPDVWDIGHALGLDVVPIIGNGPLQEAIELAHEGFPSQRWPGVTCAEGLVCRPSVELFDRGGRRVIVKVKHKDFR
jgi:hypothetical protein